jgi:uncharacterized protein YecT (DUF1311 family)
VPGIPNEKEETMIVLLAALLQVAAPDALVQQRIASDPELNTCLGIDDPAAAADPASHVVACYGAAQVRADAALTAAYAKLRATYATNAALLAALAEGEKAFAVYRADWCKVDQAAEGEPRMIEATAMMCRLELTRYQLYRIDAVG